MPETPTPQAVTLATFTTLSGPDKGKTAKVHFNPASLQYSVNNTLRQGQGNATKQFVSQTTAELSMELVFDTTDTGRDVRQETDKMAKLLKPFQEGNGKVPPRVEFAWGAYRFTGMVKQYRETLDFFAPSGLPLRASVNIALASQDVTFESKYNKKTTLDAELAPTTVVAPAARGPTQSPSGMANQLGDPRAARAIAVMNGAESLRFSAGGAIAVSAQVTLGTPAAFSGGAGGGFGGGISLSATAGSGFAGLRAGAPGGTVALDARALLKPAASVGFTTGAAAGFNLGGKAQMQTATGLAVDVGANADVRTRIRFGG